MAPRVCKMIFFLQISQINKILFPLWINKFSDIHKKETDRLHIIVYSKFVHHICELITKQCDVMMFENRIFCTIDCDGQ